LKKGKTKRIKKGLVKAQKEENAVNLEDFSY